MIRVGRFATATLAAYLLGSVQSADIAGRLAAGRDGSGHKDLGTEGTSNPGGLNTAKVLGAGWGLGVMASSPSHGGTLSA